MDRERCPYTGQFKAKTYEVTVWNMATGDVEEFEREATKDEVCRIEAHYADDPVFEVQVEERP